MTSHTEGGMANVLYNLATRSPDSGYHLLNNYSGTDVSTHISWPVTEDWADGHAHVTDIYQLDDVNSDVMHQNTSRTLHINVTIPLMMTSLDACHMAWYYINGLLGTLVAIFGIPGNVTSALVLLLPTMRNSTSLLLVVMAVYDTVFLALHVLLQSLPLIFLTNNVLGGYLVVREFMFKYFYAVVHLAHTGTIYMTVLVTLERAMVVLLPLRAKQICTRERAGIASLVVVLWSVMYNIPRCMEFEPEQNANLTLTPHTVTKSSFGHSRFFNVVYLVYLNSVFHFVLPVAVIILLNAKMIQRVCTRGRLENLQGTNRSRRTQRTGGSDSQTRLTVMILTLTAIFCLCRLLAALELIVCPAEPAGRESDAGDGCGMTCSVLGAVAETSTLLNSATNFVVYSTFGRKFRRCLRGLCCYCCCFWSARGRRRRHVAVPGSFTFSSRRSPLQAATSLTLTHISLRPGRGAKARRKRHSGEAGSQDSGERGGVTSST